MSLGAVDDNGFCVNMFGVITLVGGRIKDAPDTTSSAE